ncbi:MAG: pectin esterase, partial [Bacteroidales bacterium]|nr:pectin esterase [Bacteroidales bacterium]
MKTLKTILTTVLALLTFAVQAQVITVHLMGDSTMAEKDLSLGSPERGWGMMFPNFLDNQVKVINYAHNGRSTKSFIDLGDWDKVKANVKKGDYVFIQFGHNDSKKDDPARFTEPYGAYQDNLRLYINTVRKLGGNPVLLTPVSRRWFTSEGVFKENAHTDYPAAMKAVAAELNVPLLDITTPTENWIRSAGDEATRAYFMHLPKGKYASHPEGKIDDTHLNPRGARKVTSIICEEIKKTLPEIAKHLVFYHFVVSQDGHGDFMTIQEAINAVPDYSHLEITTIYIRKGTYYENVTIPHNKFRVHLIGEDADSTIITFDKAAKKTWPDRGDLAVGTSGSAAMYIQSSYVTLENLTVMNPMRDSDGMGQAVALFLGGDHIFLKGCKLLGWQDTLYTYGYYNKFGG